MTAGFARRLRRLIAKDAFFDLDARLNGSPCRMFPVPHSPVLLDEVLPNVEPFLRQS